MIGVSPASRRISTVLLACPAASVRVAAAR